MLQYEIKVSGQVQGVGFRYFARNHAKQLNLIGWVRNTLDGGVLVNVQGPKHAIDTFADHLWIGPPMSEIASVIKTEVQVIETFTDFEIRH